MSDINKFTTKEVLNKVLLDSSGNSVAANSHTSQEALNAVLDVSNSRLNVSLGGSNTISGDVTITGDLTVQGNGTGTYDEIVEGNLQVGNSSTADSTIIIESSSSGDPKLQFTSTSGRKGIMDFVEAGTLQGSIVYDHNTDNLELATGSTNRTARLTVNETSSHFTSNLGIGVTSSIGARLHIDTPTDGNAIQFDRSGQETYKLLHGTSGLFLSKPDSTDVAVALVTQDGDFYTKDASNNFLLFSDTSTSRVGINTNSPSVALHVTGDIQLDDSAPFLLFKETGNNKDMQFKLQTDGRMSLLNDNASTEVLTVLQDGSVGLGIASPSSTMHIFSSTADGHLIVESTHALSSGVVDIRSVADRDSGVVFREGTTVKAQILNDASEDTLVLTDGANSNTVFIKSDNVGIGMTPDATTGGKIDIQATDHLKLRFFNSTDFKAGFEVATSSGDMITGSAANDFCIRSQSNVLFAAGGATESMRIDAAGKVGIGTSPARQLHVHGADGGQVDGLHITNTDTGATSGDGFTIGLDANENAFFFGRESGKRIDFYTSSTKRFSIDDNSRISLSNNDDGGTLGTDSTSGNTLFGYLAGGTIDLNTINNTFVGHKAGSGTKSDAQSNTAFGAIALSSLTSGDSNVAIGKEASENLTTGNQNVVIGTQALHTATDSSNIVAIGLYAGLDINHTDADGTVLVGRSAGESITSGSGNTAIGYQALDATTTQDNSTAIGYNAGGASAGNSNLFVGYNAGATGSNDVVSGTQNTIVGTSASASSASAQGQIVLGVGAVGQGDHTAVIGGSAVTDVYMAQDSGATVHCAGVNFPDAQVASSDANTLDDYEEGTYTPVVSNGSTTYSASVENGYYTKIGDQVFVQVFITSSEAGSGSSALHVTLPFNYNGASNKRITASVRTENVDVDSSCVQLMLANASSGTSDKLFFTQMRDNAGQLSLPASSYSSGDTIQFSVHYKVA